MGQIRDFSDQLSVHIGTATQINILKSDLKNAVFVPYVANLTILRVISDNPTSDPPENCHLDVKKLPKT